jgi:hypothetical protein
MLQEEINYQFLTLRIMYLKLSCSDKGDIDVKSVTYSKDTICLLLRRNKQRNIATLKCTFDDKFVWTHAAFLKYAPQNVHKSQITALSRS